MTIEEAVTACSAIESAAEIVPEAQSKAAKDAISRMRKLLLRAVHISERSTLTFPRWVKERTNQLSNTTK